MTTPKPATAPGVLGSAALLASGTAPGTALLLRAVVEAMRVRYLGRETTLRSGQGDVRLVPTAVTTSGLDRRALATGRLEEVRLTARDVVAPAVRLRELTLVAHHVRIRPAFAPELVTGAVELTAELDPDWLAERFCEHAPGLEPTIDDGVPRVRRRHRPGLGSAELELAVHGHTVTWKVVGLTVAGRRMGPPRSAETRRSVRALVDRSPLRGIRSGSVALSGLPPQLFLHDLHIAPGRVVVHGRLDGWRRAVPPAGFDDVLRGALSLLVPSR